MSNYTKATDFAAKDSLPTGNAAKVVKGTEIDDEFAAIQTAVATKLDTSAVDYKKRIVSYNHVQKASDTSNTSQTEFDIGLSVTLSPENASNKLLIIAVVHCLSRAGGDDTGYEIALFLDDTKEFETSNAFYSSNSSVTNAGVDGSLTFVYEHSPGSTASLDIDVKANAIFATNSQTIYASGTSLTVLEIEP